MKVKTLAWLSLPIVLVLSIQSVGAQSFRVGSSVIASGGALSANSSYRMVSTVAQPVIGVSQNNANIHRIGFWYPSQRFVTAVDHPASEIPKEFRLEQNFPNPFNPSTVIRYQMPASSLVEIEIYSVHGQKIRKLVSAERAAGYHEAIWDGRDDAGRVVASGVYFYRVRADAFVDVKRMIALK